jgi:SDR family mycofactocin-dependent oxidoreductase
MLKTIVLREGPRDSKDGGRKTAASAGGGRRDSLHKREDVAMGKLEGKVALITGAARGQGRSHAVRLAQEGADIIAVDICKQIATVRYPLASPDDLEQTVKEVEAIGRRIVARIADVRDCAALRDVVAAGVAALGGIDIVVANAGIATLGEPGTDPAPGFRDVIDVNLVGVWNTIEASVPAMAGRGGGSIVLTSSTAGLKGTSGGPGYTAAKHGVVGLMRRYAVELAGQGIRVNSIHPTGVNTPMVDNDAMREFLSNAPIEFGAMTNLLPVEMIEAIDVSHAIAWLVSDEARYVTGVTLPIDAGFTLK